MARAEPEGSYRYRERPNPYPTTALGERDRRESVPTRSSMPNQVKRASAGCRVATNGRIQRSGRASGTNGLRQPWNLKETARPSRISRSAIRAKSLVPYSSSTIACHFRSHLTFALSGAPPRKQTTDAALFGASALERGVRRQYPLTEGGRVFHLEVPVPPT